ncbi:MULTISPECIES: hypothetical protein [unclassified Oceanobacter]|jgi:hypothetical protein|uniref:hypothetical protein n=1 Tax=unclassified Oceanobacter TaxID=2620260 RepID=UPI0026E1AE0C|nr:MULTISPECIES: hypothetical protein [unclassified Oceanobacter]MDO6682146.1 hypothetical protein [Oceanobacter sp. 5_MG-2023]MDP2505458.1 hypothetical protein [Oceanobacter sp. 3_MG-2023]MDP2548603.1 hypothetical protein [Oceanobacter sp. 4_MG-2023]MDP2610376.1 hypothetical protein [Oceanobacter sp. 1_MG-2023]MDP2613614.1 hypothetical protein [Oceanobacter sp. 2_MG-2023]
MSDDHFERPADDGSELKQSDAAHKQRQQALASDVEAFLSGGGQIQKVEDRMMADPPRKPQTSYGRRPI